jgi:hypothetical protein
VAFSSFAGNLVTGDTNSKKDIFVHDRQTHKTTRVSIDSSGQELNGNAYTPSISANGRYVAFRPDATDLIAGDTNGFYDIFVRGPFADFPWPMFLPAITGKN